jgi:predicted small secreted protein
MKINILVLIIIAICMSGCVNTMKTINKDLASLNNALSGKRSNDYSKPYGTSNVKGFHVLTMTKEQEKKISEIFNFKAQDQQLQQAINESRYVIEEVIKKIACVPEYSMSASSSFNAYAAPGEDFSYGVYFPIRGMKYHDKTHCASVLRIYNWRMVARNALRFEVVYTSDFSGETVKSNYEIVKQPGGEWLFSSL